MMVCTSCKKLYNVLSLSRDWAGVGGGGGGGGGGGLVVKIGVGGSDAKERVSRF